MSRPLVVFGMGGHGSVVAATARACGRTVLGYADGRRTTHGDRLGLRWLGDDEAVREAHRPGDVDVAVGIGSTDVPHARRRLAEALWDAGYAIATIVHPSAIVESEVELGDGCQILAGAVVQIGCRIGTDAIVNTGVNLDHDCSVGEYAHLAPGAVCSGGVRIGPDSHIGTNSTVIQDISIGRGTLVAAGAVVVEDVPDGKRVAGVPAREMTS